MRKDHVAESQGAAHCEVFPALLPGLFQHTLKAVPLTGCNLLLDTVQPPVCPPLIKTVADLVLPIDKVLKRARDALLKRLVDQFPRQCLLYVSDPRPVRLVIDRIP